MSEFKWTVRTREGGLESPYASEFTFTLGEPQSFVDASGIAGGSGQAQASISLLAGASGSVGAHALAIGGASQLLVASGQVSGSATASGAVLAVDLADVDGTAAGSATVQATPTTLWAASGDAHGSGPASAIATAIHAASAISTGVATASGAASVIRAVSGSAGGQGETSGSITLFRNASGLALGLATLQGDADAEPSFDVSSLALGASFAFGDASVLVSRNIDIEVADVRRARLIVEFGSERLSASDPYVSQARIDLADQRWVADTLDVRWAATSPRAPTQAGDIRRGHAAFEMEGFQLHGAAIVLGAQRLLAQEIGVYPLSPGRMYGPLLAARMAEHPMGSGGTRARQVAIGLSRDRWIVSEPRL